MEHEALPQHRNLNILPSAPHPTCLLMEVEPLTNNVRMKKRYYQEHMWNLGTFWEPKGNPPLLPQPKTQKKKTKPHGAFSLAA
jgi:hypothetical protein